jgi:hypothetical protein
VAGVVVFVDEALSAGFGAPKRLPVPPVVVVVLFVKKLMLRERGEAKPRSECPSHKFNSPYTLMVCVPRSLRKQSLKRL